MIEFQFSPDEKTTSARLGKCHIFLASDQDPLTLHAITDEQSLLRAPSLRLYFQIMDMETVVPCDATSCPSGKEPSDIDACVKKCPFKYSEWSPSMQGSLLGEGLAGMIKTFRQTASAKKSTDGCLGPYGRHARMFARMDWSIGGVIYPAS